MASGPVLQTDRGAMVDFVTSGMRLAINGAELFAWGEQEILVPWGPALSVSKYYCQGSQAGRVRIDIERDLAGSESAPRQVLRDWAMWRWTSGQSS